MLGERDDLLEHGPVELAENVRPVDLDSCGPPAPDQQATDSGDLAVPTTAELVAQRELADIDAGARRRGHRGTTGQRTSPPLTGTNRSLGVTPLLVGIRWSTWALDDL